MKTALELVAVALIVAANGFFVAAEYALVTVRRTRLQELEAQALANHLVVIDDQTRNWLAHRCSICRMASYREGVSADHSPGVSPTSRGVSWVSAVTGPSLPSAASPRAGFGARGAVFPPDYTADA